MYQKISSRFLNKSEKHYIIKIIDNSIKINRFKLNKSQVNLLDKIKDRLLSKANVIDNLEMVLINDCISSLNLIERVNKSREQLKSKKVREVELRCKKLNKEKFKSIFYTCLSTFLLVLISVSE